jgi:acetyl-CoA C-acetyltransferase
MPITKAPVYIVDGLRTPFLKASGSPSSLKASDLAVAVGRDLLARQPFLVDDLDEVILGCVMPEATEANIGRVLALRLGSITVPGWTVQRNCASGLQALDCAWQKISSGASDLVLAGGTEAMSRAPILWRPELIKWWAGVSHAKSWTEKVRALSALHFKNLKPTIGLLKGLTDPVIGLSMGQTAEYLADKYGIERGHMDAYAYQSHQLTAEGYAEGHFSNVMPLIDLKGHRIVQDTGLRKDTTPEKLAMLKPVFEPPFGKVTAGNSSLIADGACLLLLASQQAVDKYQLPVLGKMHQVAWSALAPIDMGLGPVSAMTAVLEKQKLTWDKIDYVEINEAFAAQVLACVVVLGKQFPDLSLTDKLNIYGGSIAIGHPVGASGARLVLDMCEILQRKQASRGLISLCIGGGQGGAVLLERGE